MSTRLAAVVLTVSALVASCNAPENASNVVQADWVAMNPKPVTSGGNLYGVWGASSCEWFGIGGGVVVHTYDQGKTWSETTLIISESFYGISGSGASDVYMVGSYSGGGVVYRWNGGSWSSVATSTSTLKGVWTNGTSDEYVVGFNGTILHGTSSGSSWTTMTSGTMNALLAVWGTSNSNVYAVGGNGTILHYNGTSWSSQSLMTSDEQFNSIWGSSDTDIYAAAVGGIYHSTGNGTWSKVNGGWFTAVWGSSFGDVYAVGFGGIIVNSTDGGSTWSAQTTDTTWWRGIWGNGRGNVVIVGHDLGAAHNVNPAVTFSAQTFAGSPNVNGLWGASACDVYAVGASGNIWHTTSDTPTWANEGSVPSSTTLYGVWGLGPGNVYAVGSGGAMYHYNGSWSSVTSGTSNDLRAFWNSTSRYYAVGANGTILFSSDGTTWSPQTSGVTALLLGIWGSSSTDIYVVGTSGTILHSANGTTWSAQTTGTTDTFSSVWGSDSSHVYVADSSSNVMRFSIGSGTWRSQTTPSAPQTVWGRDSSHIFAGTGNGNVISSDGTGSWTNVGSTGSTLTLAIWGGYYSDLYFGGSSGVIGVGR